MTWTTEDFVKGHNLTEPVLPMEREDETDDEAEEERKVEEALNHGLAKLG